MKLSQPVMSLSVKRGEKIAKENQYLLLDDKNLYTDGLISSFFVSILFSERLKKLNLIVTDTDTSYKIR